MTVSRPVDWSYSFEIIFAWVLMFYLTRLLCKVLPIINDPVNWMLEAEYREAVDMHWHFEPEGELDFDEENEAFLMRGQNDYYLIEIWKILIGIIACAQGILLFTLADMMTWSRVMLQIVEFYQMNGKKLNADISSDILEIPYSCSNYFYYFFLITFAGIGIVCLVDLVFKILKDVAGSSLFLVLFVWSFVFSEIFILIASLRESYDECSAGEYELLSLIGTKKDQVFFSFSGLMDYFLEVLSKTAVVPTTPTLNVTKIDL